MGFKIALSGKMCSGKSVVAEYLVQQYGFTEYSFAKRLKDMAAELFDIKVKDAHARYVYQALSHLREIDPYVWVRALYRYLPLDDPRINIVISDVRFPNECDTLRKNDFQIWRMDMSRDEQERIIRMHYTPDMLAYRDDHSEIALDNYGFNTFIHNDTEDTLQHVYRQVDVLMQSMIMAEGASEPR